MSIIRGTYQPFGLLFDSTTVEVDHVASTDSGSGTGIGGELIANSSELSTVEDLKNYYKDREGSQAMNEVNAKVHKNDIVGLIMKKGTRAPKTLVEIEVIRKFLEENQLNLRVYEYDDNKGVMSKYNSPDIDNLLTQIRPENFQQAYKKALGM